jgi:hypothetical protein
MNGVADLASRRRLGFTVVVPQSGGRQEQKTYQRNAGYDSPASDKVRIENKEHSFAYGNGMHWPRPRFQLIANNPFRPSK